MNKDTKIIRDFLYLDVDRLYSLASQVFEGVTAQIAHSYQSEQSKVEVLKGVTKNSDERVTEAALRTENKVLHDHLYHQFEERISDAIVDLASAKSVSYESLQANGVFVKIKGIASIDDYNRMSGFLDEFNLFGVALAYVGSSHTGEIEQARADLELEKENLKNQIHASKNPLTKSQLKERLKNLEDATQPLDFLQMFAASKGLYRDPMLLHSIKTITEAFQAGAYEINISQPYLGATASFRSVLDKRWLRSEPEYLRSLYAGASIGTSIVVIGQITALPDDSNLSKLTDSDIIENSDEVSLTDVSHQMFRLMGALDEMTNTSNKGKSVMVQPLAIYKEIILPAV